MTIAFRVDASRQMGVGHLRRCLSLAQALGDATPVHFVTRTMDVDSRAMIEDVGFDATTLPSPQETFEGDPAIPHSRWAGVDAAVDLRETVTVLSRVRPDWVIIDHYSFDASWHRAVKKGLGCRIAAIDDLADRDFGCDLLIDHNFADHRAKYAGRLPYGTTLLGGPRYALLGPAYASAPRYRPSSQVRSIGIFMGGVDAANHSATVLDAIRMAGFSGPVEVATTSANPNLEKLRQVAAGHQETSLLVDLADLAAFFARHDLQIGAGGGASWERCCIGAPTLALVVAENQQAVAPALAAKDVIAMATSLAMEDIANDIRALVGNPSRRMLLAENAAALVDGRGAQRVAKVLTCSE